MKTLLFTAALMLLTTTAIAGYHLDDSSAVTVSRVSVFNEKKTGHIVQFQETEDTHNTASGENWNYTEWGKINCKTHIYHDGGDSKEPDWDRYDSQDITSTKYKKIEAYVCGNTAGENTSKTERAALNMTSIQAHQNSKPI